MPSSTLTLSIVSHRQGEMVRPLLEDIQRHCQTPGLSVVLTLNVPERLPFSPSRFSYPISLLINPSPKGFGANHNQAFWQSQDDFFGVLNPDLRFSADPFPGLLATLQSDAQIGVVAPRIIDSSRKTVDNARRFPTPLRILKRLITRTSKPDYSSAGALQGVDWLAGLFLLFPRPAFTAVTRFDEGYFLYFEDVDLCARLTLQGSRVVWNPEATSVTHQAQRRSHRDLLYLKWHLTSMIRFFKSPIYAGLRRGGHL